MLTSLLQWEVNPRYVEYVSCDQFGGVPKRGSALASHTIRTFMDLCRSFGLSFLVIFIDLSKAFDRAIRELVMGAMKGADVDTRSLFLKLGLTQVQAEELSNFIETKGPLLAQMGVDAKLIQLIRSLHAFA